MNGFFDEIYALAAHDPEAATDRVFDTIDRLLCDGRECDVDDILSRVDVTKLPTTLLRSFLTITATARGRLHSRRAFYVRAYSEMERQRGVEVARRVLGRLA